MKKKIKEINLIEKFSAYSIMCSIIITKIEALIAKEKKELDKDLIQNEEVIKKLVDLAVKALTPEPIYLKDLDLESGNTTYNKETDTWTYTIKK